MPRQCKGLVQWRGHGPRCQAGAYCVTWESSHRSEPQVLHLENDVEALLGKSK